MNFTVREKEVLMHLRSGRTSRAIAERLGISERTVKFHTGNILKKLHADNRLEAVVKALDMGWIA